MPQCSRRSGETGGGGWEWGGVGDWEEGEKGGGNGQWERPIPTSLQQKKLERKMRNSLHTDSSVLLN